MTAVVAAPPSWVVHVPLSGISLNTVGDLRIGAVLCLSDVDGRLGPSGDEWLRRNGYSAVEVAAGTRETDHPVVVDLRTTVSREFDVADAPLIKIDHRKNSVRGSKGEKMVQHPLLRFQPKNAAESSNCTPMGTASSEAPNTITHENAPTLSSPER